MKTVVDLFVFAERYKASLFYENVLEFIEERIKAFKQGVEAKAFFKVYPGAGI